MNNLINKIHNCKNKDILPLIPDKSIQVFIEDMPYNLTACCWDKKQDLKEYWELRLSKIKDNGCFVLFGGEPFSSYLRMSNIKMYKYDWIWNKINSSLFLNAKKQPLRCYEIISIFYNNQNLYNPQKTKRTKEEIDIFYNKKSNKNFKNTKLTGKYKNILKKDIIKNDFKYKYPKNILNYKYNEKECNGLNRLHPTQKPVALFEYLIKTYSNENDLIFDGFSGSGTTAIACYNTNRNFICCELNKTYFDKSIERLKEARNNLFENIT